MARRTTKARSGAPQPEFDAIVVGSGVSGGWAAKELCERGLKVLLVDRGHMVEHGAYATEGKGAWEMPFHGRMRPEELREDYFINRFGWVDAFNKEFYIKDSENPWDFEGSTPFHWIRPNAFGGKSLIWGRWVWRWSDLDFEANKKDGHGDDWPIRYADIAPWYAHVERFIGVSGSKEGLAHLPDGEFQPPHPMNCAERAVKERLEAAYPDRKLIHARTVHLSQDMPEQGRTRCQYRDQCSRGCSFGAYFSTQSSTLPAALKTGNLTVMPDHAVAALAYDPKTKRATGVQAVNVKDKSTRTFTGRMVFLCASTIGTLQILLNTRSEEAPGGVVNSSGMLGKFIMDHIFRAGAEAVIPGFEDKIEYGRRPSSVYVPRFRNVHRRDDVDFVRGYNYECAAYRSQPADPGGFGVGLKKQMRRYGPWRFYMSGFGEALPYEDNVVSLHPSKVDPNGIPLLRFNVTFRQNERRMLLDMHRQAEEMLRAVGAVEITGQSNVDDQTPGRGIHELGGARMGSDPRRSVVNKWSQAHDVPNVFVGDGAQFASASCVNPSISFMALTARAADHAVKLAKDGVI